MNHEDKVTETYVVIDDFYKEFAPIIEKHLLKVSNDEKKRKKRTSRLSPSEVMTILALFHLGGYRRLKHFYLNYVCRHMTNDFPTLVSYSRFVELQQKMIIPLGIFLKTSCLGRYTGISFIDSTPLKVCHIKREKQNRVFKGTAAKGQCSISWFYGLKLHLIINDRGEILDFIATQANTDDRAALKNSNFHKRIFGKLVGEKGYISKSLFEQLFIDGVHLVRKIKKT